MRAIDIAHGQQADPSLALDLDALGAKTEQNHFVRRFAHDVDEVIL